MAKRPKQPEAEGAGNDRVEAFIRRWQGREGGQERANYALFLTELCGALDLDPPDPASAAAEANDYVFERVVRETGRDGTVSNRRIDFYRRGAFVMEAKQSRQKGGDKEVPGQGDLLLPADDPPRGRRGADRAWDVLMMNARQQAEGYVRLLPTEHAPPPFVIVCDVGHCFEIYANFRRDGKAYDQFPDRRSFRIYLDDLRQPEIRELLATIWRDPQSLDPARKSARVTRDIAERLAAVSKALEAAKRPPEEVAMFLMRCLFTMFAEDIGLLPDKSFKRVLERWESEPDKLAPMVGQLWEMMDKGGFAYAIETNVRRFNGEFFKTRTVLPLKREEIGELRQAAGYNWRDVDPSIFGTLLEQALDPDERRRLGAHYTPRAYVERLVIATVIEPLRDDWRKVLSTAERQKTAGRAADAVATVRAFHKDLCEVRILDPACGTGNFLYVALELLKRLEGEVLEALADLGGQEALAGFEGLTVDPHQFLGLEINARAAAIAELVLWIGHLQWHARTKGGLPSEPILKAFHNIEVKDAVLSADKVLARDTHGKPLSEPSPDGTLREVYRYNAPRRPDWPSAHFIVGNPPFIGKGEQMRSALGQPYLDALKVAHPQMNESADFVLYWWDRAADLLTRKGTILRRFGLVTTNSITQVFNRKVVQRHLQAKRPISMVMAIPDHPWTKATPDSAAIRIAMTVAEAGTKEGLLEEVVREAAVDTDSPAVGFRERRGTINSDLTVGVDVTKATSLQANEGLASMGPALGGRGFAVTRQEAEHLGGKPGAAWLKTLTTGRDITGRHRNRYVIDVREYPSETALRLALPAIYQYLRTTVYPERVDNNDPKLREFWWRYRRSNETYFNAIEGLSRFIATVETTKHRVFVFVKASELLEHGVIGFGLDEAWHLGVLSSRIHTYWALANGGTLEDRPRYNKDVCFDPFPLPDASEDQKAAISALAEEIDALRKRVLAEHSDLTLTGLYNVLEELRRGAAPDALGADHQHILDAGLVLILKELHEKLDAAVADAYGWPVDLADEDILARVVALNRLRAGEEANGTVRWLRPEYQIPRFGNVKQKAELDLIGAAAGQDGAARAKPTFPSDDVTQTAVVMAALAGATAPMDAATIASRFRQGRRIEPAVSATLAAIARMGFIVAAGQGNAFALRRGQ